MSKKRTKTTELRDYWVKVTPHIKGQSIMLINRDTGITWGRFYIEDFELTVNGKFELVLLTSSQHTPRITVDETNPWLIDQPD